MKRFIHIQPYRSVVLVALAVLFAAFMMIGAPVVIADDTSGTTTPTGDTSGGDTSGGDTSSGGDTTSSGDTSGGDTSGTTPTGDTNEDTLARHASYDAMDYLAYCAYLELDIWNGEC